MLLAYEVIGRPTSGASPELHGIAHDAAEHVVIADDAQLIEHVLRQVRPPVVERGQESEDLEVPVELESDRVDDLDEVRQALHRVVLRLHRDDHASRGDQAVDRQESEVGRTVDDHVVVGADLVLERFAQDLLAAQGGEQFTLGGREVDVRRGDIDARRSRS